MARGRTRVSSYGRGQMQKGIAASQEFGSGFSKLAGGVADIVRGVASAGSQAASASERLFNRPRVTPVTTSAPGSLSATSAPKPTVSAASTDSTPADKSATATPATKPDAAPKTAPAPANKPTAPVAGKSLQSRISSLASTNKIANVNKIYAGKTIDVGGSKYTIQKGDTLTSIAKKFPGQGQTTTAPTEPTKQTMQGGLTDPNIRMKPASEYSGQLSPKPIEKQDTGLTAATPRSEFRATGALKNFQQTPPSGTTGTTSLPNISGSAAPSVRASSDKGGFMKGKSLDVPSSSEPASKSDNKPSVSSALQDRIKPENLGSNPENIANKDVFKGRETNNRSVTPQAGGSVTTAPEPAKSSSTSGADKQWNERPKFDYSKAGGGKGGTPMNESTVNVGGNKYRIV